MIPASAPVRVRDRLRRAPDGPVTVVHRGPDAIYLAIGDGCVGVTGRHAVAVPCALHTRVERFDVAAARMHGGVLHLDGVGLAVRRLVDTRVPALPATAAPVTAAPATAPSSPAGLVDLPATVTAATVPDLVGRGDGLTPLGDDVLCGWLALHRAARMPTPDVDDAVRACLHRTTLLSAELLRCALDGEVIPQFAALVTSSGAPAAAAALTAVGHTSGLGMLHGARLALRELELSALHPSPLRPFPLRLSPLRLSPLSLSPLHEGRAA